MSSLRAAMQAVDNGDERESYERPAHLVAQEAVGRALIETEVDDRDPPEKREAERQAREDAATADATEIVMRARSRVGRTKWSATEGRVIRQIVEALRCLPSDD